MKRNVTIRVTPIEMAKIDSLAAKNGLCRAHFMHKCAKAGYHALVKAGEMK